MKIIIVGLGETGRSLVKLLDGSEHDITVIDKDKAKVDMMTDRYSVNGICGSGASTETLMKAGAHVTDVLVALTHIDEINLLACMQAKACGTRNCTARILMPDLADERELLKEKYRIDYIISPKKDLAKEIYANIGLPGYVKLESCIEDKVYAIDINAVGKSPLIGRTIEQIRTEVDPNLMVGVINRGRRHFVPKDKDIVKENDGLYMVVNAKHLDEALVSLGITRIKTGNVCIVGGGITGKSLAEMLTEDKIKITIIDNDLATCRDLMELYPNANVVYAEGDMTEVLEEERVDKADSIISLTDNDETNLVISMFAWSNGVKSVITRVDKQVHLKLLHKVNIDITISPTELCVFRIMRFIHGCMDKNDDENLEIMEFIGDLRRF